MKKKYIKKIQRKGKRLSRKAVLQIRNNEGKLRKWMLITFVVSLWGFTILASVFIREINSQKEVPSGYSYDEELAEDIRELTNGFPIEYMTEDIAGQDRETAAFLVSIAKKESNWGRRSPVLDGLDCYNYWGFRAERERMGSGGHTCFNSPRDAVLTVSRRIDELRKVYGRDTPEEMIVWKCGSSCETHSPESVMKWISDVEYYYEKFIDKSSS